MTQSDQVATTRTPRKPGINSSEYAIVTPKHYGGHLMRLQVAGQTIASHNYILFPTNPFLLSFICASFPFCLPGYILDWYCM